VTGWSARGASSAKSTRTRSVLSRTSPIYSRCTQVTVNTDDSSLRVHDGTKTGGWPLRAIGANYAYQTPASGATLTAPAYLAAYVLEPAATLASLTIVLPPSANDGDVFEIGSTRTITALSVSPAAGQTVTGGSLMLAANGGISFRYRAANSTWYRRY